MTTRSVLRPDYKDDLKLSEFAAIMGICVRTAHRWIKSGAIEAHQTPGGHWRVNADQLETRGLTVAQFAHLVGVHPVTVRRWCRADKITHSTSPTGIYHIPMSEVPRTGRRGKSR